MPAPIVEFEVDESAAGRRIYKNEAEGAINAALENLWTLITNIPAGPRGLQGPVGPQGEQWIVGTPRVFAEGLQCVAGNAIYRYFPATNMNALFRCLSSTTTNLANFPATPVSNATWELVLLVPGGAQGVQGLVGPVGPSPEIVEFNTDAEALTYSTAHPTAIVISKEGL